MGALSRAILLPLVALAIFLVVIAALIQERENVVSYLGQSSPVIRSPMDAAAETGRRR